MFTRRQKNLLSDKNDAGLKGGGVGMFGHLEWSAHPDDAHGLLSKLCPLVSFLKLLLSLPELGQIECCNLLGLLNLLLVGLDLGLQAGGQITHAIIILLVFILLELQFLDAALSPLVGLVAILGLGLDSGKFHLQLADPHLKLLHGRCLSVSNTVLQLIDLEVKSALPC